MLTHFCAYFEHIHKIGDTIPVQIKAGPRAVKMSILHNLFNVLVKS